MGKSLLKNKVFLIICVFIIFLVIVGGIIVIGYTEQKKNKNSYDKVTIDLATRADTDIGIVTNEIQDPFTVSLAGPGLSILEPSTEIYKETYFFETVKSDVKKVNYSVTQEKNTLIRVKNPIEYSNFLKTFAETLKIKVEDLKKEQKQAALLSYGTNDGKFLSDKVAVTRDEYMILTDLNTFKETKGRLTQVLTPENEIIVFNGSSKQNSKKLKFRNNKGEVNIIWSKEEGSTSKRIIEIV